MEQSAMSKPLVRAQTSIRSFFQPRQPNYTPPPPTTISTARDMPKIPAARASSPQSPNSPGQADSEISHFKQVSDTAFFSKASISPIHEKHIQQLKRINETLLQINYPDSFYKNIVDPKNSPNFSRVILWHKPPDLDSPFPPTLEPKVIGGIVCRLERDDRSRTSAIYIQSLTLLTYYRSHGLATQLLLNIVQGVIDNPQIGYPVTSLYAHVWTENTEGLEWYTARGFTREEPVVQDYYRRLQPGNAWIMRRSIVPSDHLPHFTNPGEKAPLHISTTRSQAPLSTASSAPMSTESSSIPSPLPRTALKLPVARASSYQNTGPGHEWNDLPDEILTSSRKSQTPDLPGRTVSATHLTPNATISATGSAASSRSSSRSAVKKKRQYPAAAFNDTVNGSESSEKVIRNNE